MKRHNEMVSANDRTKPSFSELVSRHLAASAYVLCNVLPVILRTGRRPVIFSRFTGMGDIICTVPAARELMKRHPGRTFIYNCRKDFAAVPELAGIANRITSLEFVGIVGHWYRWLLAGFYHFAHLDDLPDRVAQEPMVAEFLRQFDLPVTDEHPRLAAAPSVCTKVDALLLRKGLDVDTLVLIHPGPSWPVKEWPFELWTRLVSALQGSGFTNIGQLGTSHYTVGGSQTVKIVPGAVSLVDELSVEECFAAISRAKLFIGIDSGLLHIAAATSTPAVGIFGATLPQFFYAAEVRKHFVQSTVECVGCFHRKPRLCWLTGCPFDIRCTKTIGVPEVLGACLASLERPQPAAGCRPVSDR
jgi:ADP-heptose:LPS heptosyltransferase